MNDSDMLGGQEEPRRPFIVSRNEDGSVTADLAAHPRAREVPPRFRKVVTIPAVLLETARACGSVPGACLYLMGGTGPGKTQLAYALALGGLRPNLSFAAYTAPGLFEALRRSYDAPRGFYGPPDPVAQCCEAGLLLIDDFGAERVTDWTRERMYQIIDTRYIDEKPVIITSNIAPEELAETQEERLVSRLSEMTGFGKFVVHLTGPDRRRPGEEAGT